jgi:hypothetical protein
LISLLNRESVVDEKTAKQEKELARKKKQYYADKFVIDTIIETTSRESLDLTELITFISRETGKGQGKCREIVYRYKGEEFDDFTFWRLEVGSHNCKRLKLLSWSLG